MKKIVPLASLILLAVLGCSFGTLVGQAPTPTVTPTRTLKPTFTATPTDTPTLVATDTPTPTETPTNTPVPTPTPTSPPIATPTPKPPAATPTPKPPTPTPKPPDEFLYEEGSMQTAPNCGSVYLKIKVVGVGGTPANDITVRLQFGNIPPIYKVTGRGDPGQPSGGEPAGEVGFTPLAPDRYHAPMDFHIQLVRSPSDATPRSNEKIVHFTDCDTAGAFTNIKFVYQW